MDNGEKYRVGDKIVELGQVYRIFKIEEIKTNRTLFYKPLFPSSHNDTLICSIPEDNLVDTNLRRPIDKKRARKLLRSLKDDVGDFILSDVNQAKEMLTLNDPAKCVIVLKHLWLDKIDETVNFTKSKKDTFELAMNRLVQEIAVALDLSVTKAMEKIVKYLEKGASAGK